MPSDTDATTALLIRARGFIERGWCRGMKADKSGIIWALDALGNPVDPTSPAATQWSASGALAAAGVTNPHAAIDRLVAAMGTDTIPKFNDSFETVEPVLAAFDRAIAIGEP